MMASETYRIQKNLKMTTQPMIQHVIDLNYVHYQGTDRLGRPLLWSKVKNYIPEIVDRESVLRFMCYFVDFLCAQMTPNVDNFLVIMDLEGFGYKNFSLDMWKSAIEVSGVSSMLQHITTLLTPCVSCCDRLCTRSACTKCGFLTAA